ncbi:MAG: hypothetical protein ABIB47_03585 [Candidatus Woesearchaeota archaeon]
MNLELINPYVMKILIAARREDSIRAISGRIGLSYGWTYKWVQDLAQLGVFKLTRMKTYLNENNLFYKRTLSYIKINFLRDVNFYYSVLNLFGISYCFTQTDAVFIWTRGGYNIARYKNFYPIFINVRKRDKKLFEEYCKKLNLSKTSKKRCFYQVYYLDNFDFRYCDGIPVDTLEETISFMKKNKYNFEPALEMIKEMHKKRIKVKYKEIITNV